MALLRELPSRQRQVFWLRRAAGFSDAETGPVADDAGSFNYAVNQDHEFLRALLRPQPGTTGYRQAAARGPGRPRLSRPGLAAG